jgi:hypothetical protein
VKTEREKEIMSTTFKDVTPELPTEIHRQLEEGAASIFRVED